MPFYNCMTRRRITGQTEDIPARVGEGQVRPANDRMRDTVRLVSMAYDCSVETSSQKPSPKLCVNTCLYAWVLVQ
jgi:hypothetical protein